MKQLSISTCFPGLSHCYAFLGAIPDPFHSPSVIPAMATLPGWESVTHL